jgi:hypothetical protein
MLIIWGYKRYAQQLAILTFLCAGCGNPAAHALTRLVTKFTFFFIPLFPLSAKYFTQCTFCGNSRRLAKEEAAQLQQQAAYGGRPGYPGQPGHQAYPAQPAQPTPHGYAPQPGGHPHSGHQQQPGYAQPGYPQPGQPRPGTPGTPPQGRYPG